MSAIFDRAFSLVATILDEADVSEFRAIGEYGASVVIVPEREHITTGVPCWCNPDTSEDGLVIHRGGH